MKKTIIILLAAFAAIVLYQDYLASKKRNAPKEAKPYVVMLSLDGFRWDYQDKAETPNLDFISNNGVRAKGLKPAFPSKTFPNHYTIATGLYPGNHGLISNSFYADDLNKEYAIRDRNSVENGKFYGGEPIWVTAEAQNVKTASYFWVGSEAKIKGYYPSIWKKYEHNFPYSQRIDSVASWLAKPFEDRPHLITWYLDMTDGVGHNYGPDSEEIVQSVEYIDSLLGVFLEKTQALEIKDSINYLIVSDHGMGAISTDKVVYLDDYLDSTWVKKAYGGNPFVLVYTEDNKTDSAYQALQQATGISSWKKEDIPERFHLKQSERISDIVVVADSSWSVAQKRGKRTYTGGTHGFDNNNRDMYGVFYAYGPAFKQAYNAGDLHNVDIYGLIANILEIAPAKTDGKPERINHVLAN